MNTDLKNLRLHKLGSSLIFWSEGFSDKKTGMFCFVIAMALLSWTKTWVWSFFILLYASFFSLLWHVGFWLMNRNGLSWAKQVVAEGAYEKIDGTYEEMFPEYASRLKTLEFEYTLFKIGKKGVASCVSTREKV